MAERPTWHEYGLILATAVATRAACTRSQVGAVIMDENHRVVSVGYNGTPAGELNCSDGGCPRGKLTYGECPPLGSYSNCKGLHAEQNAIDYAYLDENYGLHTIYVTREPCEGCFNRIQEAGIVEAHWPEGNWTRANQ